MLDEKDMELLRALFREEGERIEQRINQRMDARFQAQDKRIDTLFQAQDERIDKMFQEQEERINSRMDGMFREQRRSIMHDVKVLMDAEFKPQFNLLAEELQLIREKLIPEERMEEAEADIQVLKTSVRMLNEDMRALKKAQ